MAERANKVYRVHGSGTTPPLSLFKHTLSLVLLTPSMICSRLWHLKKMAPPPFTYSDILIHVNCLDGSYYFCLPSSFVPFLASPSLKTSL